MRRVLVAAFVTAMAQTAQAADMPDLTDLPILRGAVRDGLSSRTKNWAGYYVGVQYGVNSNNFGTAGAAAPLNALASQNSSIAGPFATDQINNKTTAQGIGGFAGYNAQWTDVVLGVDVNYNVGGQNVLAVGHSQLFPTGAYVTNTTGVATMKITDYGSARFRAGWAVDWFLPYATIGVAMGRADMTRTVTTVADVTSPTPYGPVTGVQNKTPFLYGYSYGGGLDFALFKGLFLRAEVDVNRFTTTWGMDATVTSARLGAGYKF